MTAKEFYDKVVKMREMQKKYFKSRRHEDLDASKKLEREIDAEIARVQKHESLKQNPGLDLC